MAIVTRTNGSVVVFVAITLQPGRDDVLIAAVQSAPYGQLAATVRELMRHGASAPQPAPAEEELDISALGSEL